MNSRFSWQRTAVVAVVGVALFVLSVRAITGSKIVSDASDTTLMAINLQHHGIISFDTEPPFVPTMYREPVPIIVTALAVGIVDALSGRAGYELYFSGDRARYLKCQNILWLGLLSISAFWALSYFGSSFWIGLAGTVCVSLPFLTGSATPPIDTLNSELPAAALLLPASLLLVKGICGRRLLQLAAAGLCFGVLALIKAAVLFVFAGLFVILAFSYALRLAEATKRGGLREIGVLALAFAIVVTPWMYRNYMSIGSFGISDRGGFTLHDRALLIQMTKDEYIGAFYVWSHKKLQPVVGSMLGYSPADLEEGGRLERLSRSEKGALYEDDLAAEMAGDPDAAVTFYRIGRAERTRLANEFEAMGHPHPGNAADNVLMERAIAMIRDRPGKHLAVTLPILWRSALIAFPLFVGGLIYSIRRRRHDLALFCLPSFGLLALLALLSSFAPRYSLPFRPVAIVLFLVLLQIAVAALRSRLQSNAALEQASA
jgi:hypothetical protein